MRLRRPFRQGENPSCFAGVPKVRTGFLARMQRPGVAHSKAGGCDEAGTTEQTFNAPFRPRGQCVVVLDPPMDWVWARERIGAATCAAAQPIVALKLMTSGVEPFAMPIVSAGS